MVFPSVLITEPTSDDSCIGHFLGRWLMVYQQCDDFATRALPIKSAGQECLGDLLVGVGQISFEHPEARTSRKQNRISPGTAPTVTITPAPLRHPALHCQRYMHAPMPKRCPALALPDGESAMHAPQLDTAYEVSAVCRPGCCVLAAITVVATGSQCSSGPRSSLSVLQVYLQVHPIHARPGQARPGRSVHRLVCAPCHPASGLAELGLT